MYKDCLTYMDLYTGRDAYEYIMNFKKASNSGLFFIAQNTAIIKKYKLI